MASAELEAPPSVPRSIMVLDSAGASRPKHGNDHGREHDNHLVHPSVELMEVIGDLCRLAAVFLLAGETAWTEALIEQCGDLLAHRARLVTRFPRRPRGDGQLTYEGRSPGRIRGKRWTN